MKDTVASVLPTQLNPLQTGSLAQKVIASVSSACTIDGPIWETNYTSQLYNTVATVVNIGTTVFRCFAISNPAFHYYVAGVTAEITVTPLQSVLLRKFDPDLNLNLLAPE